jgi:hypothetical protein
MDRDAAAAEGNTTLAVRPVLPQRLDWSSVMGLFILNFGALDLALSNILKLRSRPESKNAVIKKSFHEKIRCLQHLAGEHPAMVEKRDQWEALIVRMNAIRDLRNHLSHSTLLHSVAEDLKTVIQVLCLTQDVSANVSDALRLTFEELFNQNQRLADVVGDLVALDHGCEGAYKPFSGTYKPFSGTIGDDEMWTHCPADAPGSGDTCC